MTAPTNDRREVLAAVLHKAFHDHWTLGSAEPLNLYADSPLWPKLADAALAAQQQCACPEGECREAGRPGCYFGAAQEGERGGVEIAAAVEAVAALADDHSERQEPFDDGFAEGAREALDVFRASLADPAGELATHDAEVLRAAADEFDLIWNRGHDTSVHPNAHLLRERADRIAGDQS